MSTSDNNTTTQCNFLPSNSTISLGAAKWENIPETTILNGTIGIVLFLLFCLLTHIAWKREEGEYGNQNLLSFLYGYRDPEQWYLIRRYEFMRNQDKPHNHEPTSYQLYVPPKLPLINPIDAFAYRTESVSSNTERPSTSDDERPDIQEVFTDIKVKTLPDKRIVKSPSNHSPNSPGKPKETTPSGPSAVTISISQKTSPVGKSTAKSVKHSSILSSTNNVSSLSQSFFYPSILTAEQLQASALSRKLNKIFSIFFRVTDADIIYAKGLDAYEYLLFQRHLILIMAITNIFCLGLILPVHLYIGASEDSKLLPSSFQQTTIKNMIGTSNLYWIHIISAIFIVVISVFVLKSYRESIISREDTQISRRTILIGNIPVAQRNRLVLSKIIREYFKESEVEGIQFVYDTSKVWYLAEKLSIVLVAKDYCQYLKRTNNRDIKVKPTDVNEEAYCGGFCRLCSYMYVCCYYWPKEHRQSGVEFYTAQEKKLRDKITETCEEMIKKPSEYAFVTFRTHKQAKRVLSKLAQIKLHALDERTRLPRDRQDNYSKSNLDHADNILEYSISSKKTADHLSSKSLKDDPLDPTNNPHVRSIRSPIARKSPASISKTLQDRHRSYRHSNKLEGPLSWSIRYAPHPDNVEFDDLLNIATTRKITIILWHALMISIFIFFTTPNVILSMFNGLSVMRPDRVKQLTGFERALINYLSILIQVITTALLPSLITLISKQIPYEDTASKDHSIMWKVYLFLVLMVIILPSIGMSSAEKIFNTDINFRCLFPADNGAYYINYVISSIFLSTVLELIKPIDILEYCFILWTGRSCADYEAGRRYISSEFSIGMHHTGVLLIFSAVMTYCLSCPLIAPAGLLYLVVKHAVDHYHLFYSYFTKKVKKNLQNTIVIYVRVALILMLLQTTIAISAHTGISYFAMMIQTVFWITLAVFALNCFFDCTSRAMISSKRGKYQNDFCACFYLPRVIEDLLKHDAVPQTCLSRKI